MKAAPGGIWSTALDLPDGTYEYKFVVNGTEWRYDPRNPNTVSDPYGGRNSLLQVGGGFIEGSQAAAKIEIKWRSDLRVAMQEAAAGKKRILVFFGNRGSQAARYIEDNVLPAAPSGPFINNMFIPLRLDMGTPNQRAMAEKLGVFRAGIVTVYEPAGQPVKLITSIFQPQQLMQELQGASGAK